MVAGARMEAVQGVYEWVDVTSARLRSWTDREGFSLEEVDAEAFIHWDKESWENAKVGGGLSLGLV